MRDPKGVRNGKENGVWEPDAISHYIFLWSIRNSRLGTSSWGQGTKQQRKRSVTFTISFCSGVKAPTLLPCSSLLYFLTTCSALIMGLMSFVRISYTAESNIGQFFFFWKLGVERWMRNSPLSDSSVEVTESCYTQDCWGQRGRLMESVVSSAMPNISARKYLLNHI